MTTRPQVQQVQSATRAIDAPLVRLHGAIVNRKDMLAQLLSTHGVQLNRWWFLLRIEIERNPRLRECTDESIVNTFVECCRVGLEPGGPKAQAWLIPRRIDGVPNCCFQLGYRGYMALIRRSPDVDHLNTPKLVYKGDMFKVHQGTYPEIVHTRTFEHDDDDSITHAYVVWTKNGRADFVVVDRAEIEKRRAASMDWRRNRDDANAIWNAWFPQMAMRAPLVTAANFIRLAHEERQAIELDQQAEIGEPQAVISVEAEAIDSVPAGLSACPAQAGKQTNYAAVPSTPSNGPIPPVCRDEHGTGRTAPPACATADRPHERVPQAEVKSSPATDSGLPVRSTQTGNATLPGDVIEPRTILAELDKMRPQDRAEFYQTFGIDKLKRITAVQRTVDAVRVEMLDWLYAKQAAHANSEIRKP